MFVVTSGFLLLCFNQYVVFIENAEVISLVALVDLYKKAKDFQRSQQLY